MNRIKTLNSLGITIILFLALIYFPYTIPSVPVSVTDGMNDENAYFRKIIEWSDQTVLPQKEIQTLLPRVIDTPPFQLMRKKIDHGPGVNLSLGKPYTVEVQREDTLFRKLENNYPDQEGKELTDGIYGRLDWKKGGNPWVAFLRQEGRWITVDLKKVMKVQSISLDFLQRLDGGVSVPEYVRYEGSTDGKRWFAIGTVKQAVKSWEPKPDSDPFLLKGLNVNARFIRAYFPTTVLHFIDEFTVYGSTTDRKSASSSPVRETPQHDRGYLRPFHLEEGVRHLLLHYVRPNEFRKIDFQPLMTYINREGKVTDWMYDSILFVPRGITVTKKAWEEWLDEIFFDSAQMSNLNTAVAFGKIFMSGKDPYADRHKVKLLITIPYPSLKAAAWDESNGRLINFIPYEVGQHASYTNRLQAVKWFIDQALERWQRASYSNLELVGFYWDGETLNLSAQYEKNLVKDTADYLHHKGLKYYWIPYYGAFGAEEWKELGFDAAMIQPTYSFADVDVTRLERVAEWARRYGTGIEIEAHWFTTARDKQVAERYKNRYFNYLTAGHLQKYEYSTMNGWYMNLSTLFDAYASPDPFYREIYDNTYLYLKELWAETEYLPD